MSAAPERIWAKTHGTSTDVISGARGLIGGWNEHPREGQIEYTLTEIAEREKAELRAALVDQTNICIRVEARRAEAITRAEAAERQLAELAARSGALTQDAVAWLGVGAGFKSFTYKKTVADRWLKDGLVVTPVATLHPAAPQAPQDAEKGER